MTKRGRPRYPDILTPREWEVLALLREGLSNDGIAGRLEITERTAKYHVSEILGKLGLTSRDEAAAWQPEERRPWWAGAGVPVAFLWRKVSVTLPSGLSSVAMAISVGLFAAALGGLALMGFLLLRGENTSALESITCAQPAEGGFNEIEWVNYVRFDGIMYTAHPRNPQVISASQLGPEFAKVRCQLSSLAGPTDRPQDGDSLFLEPGTTVYEIQGYDPAFRLAARMNGLPGSEWQGQLLVYEADTNPKAKTGADLLDIGGKVQSISVNSPGSELTELGAIDDPDEVSSLVDMVLAAPVDQSIGPSHDFPHYVIAFHLEDGTIVTRAYALSPGVLHRGINLPDDFQTAVERAVQANP